jgi:hypothetical protein
MLGEKMKTKKLYILIGLGILVSMLAACSGDSDQTSTTSSTSGTAGAQGSSSLSQVNMLLVGTLKLEDTDQAVTADEATKLLPLWQAYRSLSDSQTTADVEVDALLNQIQTTMTFDQVYAIKAMNLTSTDMMDLMQSMGVGMGPQGTPDPQSTPGVDFPTGGFPGGDQSSGSAGAPPSGSGNGTTRNFPFGGDIPAGGMGGGVVIGGDAGSAAGLDGGPMLQGTQNPSMQATAQARFSTRSNQVNSVLLDMLITKLEGKTAG